MIVKIKIKIKNKDKKRCKNNFMLFKDFKFIFLLYKTKNLWKKI